MLLVVTQVLGRKTGIPGAAKQLTMRRADPTEKNYVVQRLIAPSLRNPDLE